MILKNLLKGVAIIIDDEVHDKNANISNILKQIKNINIPCLTYTDIPKDDIVKSFQGLSFVLLDWQLINSEVSEAEREEGVLIPDTLKNEKISYNIAFIKMIKNICFCPIFIFTNENVDEIISILEINGLYGSDKPNHIFVKSKSDFRGKNKLKKHIEKWIKGNPSIYVLKEWEKEYQVAKNKLFVDFHDLSPVWPIIMWKNFGDDGSDKSFELGELIAKNIQSRMSPFEFTEELFKKRILKKDNPEVRRVLEGERYLKVECLRGNTISTGDIFRKKSSGTSEEYQYYLNIRAQCDLVRSKDMDKVDLYCLKGRAVPYSNIKKKCGVSFNSGQFNEKVNHAIIPFLDSGNIVEFKFRDMIIKKWKELKDIRVGQLLPPYITRIQQRYALYLQRQGLPRTPISALYEK